MTTEDQATPEQWAIVASAACSAASQAAPHSCLLELRSRIEALEATQHAHAGTFVQFTDPRIGKPWPNPSPRLTPEDLGDYAYSDPLANAALKAGRTQCELIHDLLVDRAELLKKLVEAKMHEVPERG